MGAQNAKLSDANTNKSKIQLKLAHPQPNTLLGFRRARKQSSILEANKWSKKCLKLNDSTLLYDKENKNFTASLMNSTTLPEDEMQ